jgi:dipeptidyl aminopeptidase/acylaminoacyl peptidase
MSVVALMTQSTIFKAAVGTNGYYDLFSFYGTLTAEGRDPGAFVMESYNHILTNPWKNRRVFEENSPVLQLDRTQTPLLLVHGTADSVNANQGDEIFVGLRRLGRKVTYVKYEGEGHVPYDWSPEHQIDFADRTFAWFDEHLRERVPGTVETR